MTPRYADDSISLLKEAVKTSPSPCSSIVVCDPPIFAKGKEQPATCLMLIALMGQMQQFAGR